MTRLKNKNHGLYCSEAGQKLLDKNPAVIYYPIYSDRSYMHYIVVHGLPIDQHEEMMIYRVRGDEDKTHAVFNLITGTTVMTWEKKILEELWKLGASLTVHAPAQMPKDFSDRLRYRKEAYDNGMGGDIIELTAPLTQMAHSETVADRLSNLLSHEHVGGVWCKVWCQFGFRR